MKKRLTRAEIKESLKATPIEAIVLGAGSAHGVKLTKKQKTFAKKIVETGNQAEAYRQAYNTKASKQSQAEQASRLAKHPKIKSMVEALTVAEEAKEYLLPEEMGTLAKQNLMTILTDENEKTSNKLKAIELIGKLAEVSLWKDKTVQHLHLHSTTDLKAQLLQTLQRAFANSQSISQDNKQKAVQLLQNLSISEAIPQQNQGLSDPTHSDPPKILDSEELGLHTIPDKQSPNPDDGGVTPVTAQGGGGQKTEWVEVGVDIEMTPLTDWQEK